MTATTTLEALAGEFSAKPEHIQNVLNMLDAGLCPPFIGRFRRAEIDGLPESAIRRIQRRRAEFEELDRRRGTILRLLEKEPHVRPEALAAIQRCPDRFELEDLFLPHRRPEPEVQLALDRGLGALADLLVAPISKAERAAILGIAENDLKEEKDEGEAKEGLESDSSVAQETQSARASESNEGGTNTETASETQASHEASAVALEAVSEAPASEALASEAASESAEDEPEEAVAAPTLDPAPSVAHHAHIDLAAAMNAQLARACQPFVRPDKGIHTESEALAGALRILSDRLGRDPRLRSTLRRLLAKQGVLSVRVAMDEGRIGRHRSLLKFKAPLRNVQGHRLLAIRQAQKERALNTVITLEPRLGLPKVRNALGRHTHPAYDRVLDEVAQQALNHRLLPMLEQDVRLELKERADYEALRYLAQHLRQILYTPPLGRWPVAGVDVNAKGDWTVAVLDPDGNVLGSESKIEVGEKDLETLGKELVALFEPHGARGIAVGNGKGPRAATLKLRAALKAVNFQAWVVPVNEAGLSSYANSELARNELAERSVPARMAITLGRRLQDPLAEILKVDPRHLGLGSEQGLVSKANVKRILVETVESAVAHVGCDVNRAPLSVLASLPGIDRETAKRILARRSERPFTSREELRSEGILTEAQWFGAIAFLRVDGSSEPLDATGLHPEQYPLVRRLLDGAGTSVEQALGHPGSTKGLRRAEAGIDEATWRDLMREIAFPGRDPRPWLQLPTLLDPETEAVRLVKDRVVEGIVTNVASFGCFVDVGLAQDAMVHISEISDRYVRDARELLSVGQSVRARIVEAGDKRLSLSLKNVPLPERAPRPERPRREDGPGGGAPREGGDPGRGRGEARGRGRARGRGEREEPKANPNVRAAQTRRDGGGGKSMRGNDRRGGPGARGGKPGDQGERDEYVRLDKVDTGPKAKFNPFASFFKKPDEPSKESSPQ